MCTALIYRNPKTLEIGLGFNRDESYIRKKAELPSFYERNEVWILSPKDGDHHGTWIGVNDVGEVYALLNLYEVKLISIEKPVSRGLLVSSLLEKKISIQNLSSGFLKNYLPFRLIFLTKERTYLFTWDGKTLQEKIDQNEWKVFASSALHGKEAEKKREETFTKNFLKNFNGNFFQISSEYLACHIPEKGSFSPCMHRDVAHTVSQSIILIQDKTANFFYKDGQPCEQKNFTNYSLNLK